MSTKHEIQQADSYSAELYLLKTEQQQIHS